MSLYVASLLPPLYRSQRASSWQRLWREIKVYHPVVSALIEEREGRAQLQALHILTLATSSFFILALLASLQVPTIDDGHALCTKHHNDYDSCLAERTIFDSATGLCEWDAYYAECNYPEGGPTMTRFAYASILVIFSVAVVPVHLMIDYLCTRYILAPTAADIDKDDDEVFVQTATRASSVIRTAELDKRKREARFIASMEKGDEDEGDSSIHGYHSDIDKKNLKEASGHSLHSQEGSMHIFGPGMAAVEAARGLSILGTEAHGRVTTNHVHLYQRHKYSAEASAKQLDEDIAKAKAHARHEEEVEEAHWSQLETLATRKTTMNYES